MFLFAYSTILFCPMVPYLENMVIYDNKTKIAKHKENQENTHAILARDWTELRLMQQTLFARRSNSRVASLAVWKLKFYSEAKTLFCRSHLTREVPWYVFKNLFFWALFSLARFLPPVKAPRPKICKNLSIAVCF